MAADPGSRSLIPAGSPVFAAIAAATLLVGGLAGIATGDDGHRATDAEAAAATSAAHPHGDRAAAPGDDHGHTATGTATVSDHPHAAAAGPDGHHGIATDDATGADHGDHGDHVAGGSAAEGAGGHSGHAGAGDHGDHTEGVEGDHHLHAAGCADDHPVTVRLVRDVQANLVSTYKDIAALVALGYHPYFDSLVPGGYPPGGEGISHWINPNYIDDGVILDPQRPETVLLDDWNWPIGMMFINDPGVAPTPVYSNEDGSVCSPWHPHTDAPARFGWYYYRAVYDREMEDEVPAQTPEMMHVWAIHNPAGVYAAHDYPPREERAGAPGPIPSYFSEVAIPGA